MITITTVSENSWAWLGAIVVLVIGGFLFFDHMMRKGMDRGSSKGSGMSSAFSALQTMVNPSHRHVIEMRERKRGEHDDSGDDPEPGK